MMWGKNTDGNLMIGKGGKEGKRERKEKELERTSLRRFGGTLTWTQLWHTELSSEFLRHTVTFA